MRGYEEDIGGAAHHLIGKPDVRPETRQVQDPCFAPTVRRVVNRRVFPIVADERDWNLRIDVLRPKLNEVADQLPRVYLDAGGPGR
jgi:hypothetical protein